MAQTVFKTIEQQKVLNEQFFLSESKEYLCSKTWYQESESVAPHTLFLQLQNLRVYDFKKNGDLIIACDDTNLLKMVDNMTVEFVKASGVTKTHNLSNLKYKPFLNTVEVDTPTGQKKESMFKLRVMNNTTFHLSNKQNQSQEEIKKLLTKDCSIKMIVELEGIMIDLQKSFIFANVVLRQVLINKVVPIRYELVECSFLDSEEEPDFNSKRSDQTKNSLIESDSDEQPTHVVSRQQGFSNTQKTSQFMQNMMHQKNEQAKKSNIHDSDDESSSSSSSDDSEIVRKFMAATTKSKK